MPTSSQRVDLLQRREQLLRTRALTAAAATLTAKAAASRSPSPRPRRQARAAVNASPAPVVSRASTLGLTRWSRDSVRLSATRAPAAPRVITTERGPSASRAGAQSCGDSPAPSPRMYRASCSLTTSGSQAASTSSGAGRAGTG